MGATAEGNSTASPSGSLLLSVPAAELHRVAAGQQQLVEAGPFSITIHEQQQQQTAQPAAAGGQQQGRLYPQLYQSPADSSGAGPSGGKDGGSSRIVASVGRTSWELLPGSQTLRVGEVSFVFSTPDQGVFYTVTLASNTDPEAAGMLEAILESCTIYKESEALLQDSAAAAGEAALAERTYKSSLARGVATTSRKLASGLLASSTYASNAITKNAKKFMPEQPTATPVAVSPGLKKRLAQTEKLAGSASYLVNGAVSGLAWGGAKLAGAVLWMAGANKPVKAGEDAGTMREVGHAAVVGFAEAWTAMEDAGRVVFLSARDNTAQVVQQRYGADAAEASMHSMNAAGYSADAFLAARKLGVRTVAKSAAKKTAKGVIHSWARVEAAPTAPAVTAGK